MLPSSDQVAAFVLKWLYVGCVLIAIGVAGYGAFIIVAQVGIWLKSGVWASYSMQQLLWDDYGYWFTSTGLLGVDKIIKWLLAVHPGIYLWLGAFLVWFLGIICCLLPHEELELKMARKNTNKNQTENELLKHLDAALGKDTEQ